MQPRRPFRTHGLVQHAEEFQQHPVHRDFIAALHSPAQRNVGFSHRTGDRPTCSP